MIKCLNIFRIEELNEALDERDKMKQVVKEREEKIETLNKSFDEKDKLLQDLESRFVPFRLTQRFMGAAFNEGQVMRATSCNFSRNKC